MPIIPLLNSSKPLGDAPGAVLDRNRRPTVDNSGVASAVGQLAKSSEMPLLPGDALAAPYEALGSVGRAVAQGGGILGALAIKMEEAQTDVQVADFDNESAMELAKFEEWKIKSNADPSTWSDEFAKRAGAFRERIGSQENLTGNARQVIGARLTRWEGQASASVLTGAARETFSRAKSGYLATIDRATEDQDAARFKEAVEGGTAKGYLYPHEAENFKQRFTKVGEQKTKEAKAETEKQEFEIAAADAITDPRGWMERNDKPWKDKELLWQRVKNVADAREREGTAQVIDDVQNAIASGQITVPGEVDAIDNPLLTPALREQVKGYLLRRNALEESMDKEANGVRNAVELRKEVTAYDPAKDPDRTKYFELVQRIGSRVEQSMAGELTGELYRKYGTQPPKLEVRPEIQRSVSKQLDVLFDPKTGAIPWQREVPKTTAKGRPMIGTDGKPMTERTEDPAAKRQAIEAQAIIETKMNDWFRANPQDANSPAKVREKLDSLIPEGVRGAVFMQLQSKSTPQASAGTLNDDLISAVKDMESFIPKAYSDFKQTSVGYGTRAKSKDEVLTEAEADARLREELAQHAARVDDAAAKVGATLTQGQRNALISFDFNTGQGASLLESSGGNLAEIKRRMALYTKAGGRDLPGLAKRRKTELELFNS